MEQYETTYNLSSLEGRFTDFDQWVQRLEENFEIRSSQRNTATEKKHEEPIDNTFIFKLQELHVEVASWGQATNPPILLVHGYMDSVATFIPLIGELPDNYYYVGFDIPGHGKSDAFPPGIISHQHIVEVIRRVVLYMEWESFTLMAHSMACVIGMFYNHLYPGKITKCIYIDPRSSLIAYYYVHHKQLLWYNFVYLNYYDNYERFNADTPKLYTIDEAISSVTKKRGLSKEQAEIILSRSLVPVENDKYMLSWDPRSKKISAMSVSEETFYTIITKHSVPTLVIEATNSSDLFDAEEFINDVMEECKNTLPDYQIVTVEGAHDVHITNPEVTAEHVAKFLRTKFGRGNFLSKL
ncbi:hypothetical protein K1T71_014461 [Dendrolimus kikuchii]|uniref:Uncharacterized protein n=1 Tax=Dendrolimus kikuchii TaxID=765133 RepID=A0ACC1CEE2_9NEOP|nr:hypothetical protein K1T71_014461 [Dendrolimus kikuchii]